MVAGFSSSSVNCPLIHFEKLHGHIQVIVVQEENEQTSVAGVIILLLCALGYWNTRDSTQELWKNGG